MRLLLIPRIADLTSVAHARDLQLLQAATVTRSHNNTWLVRKMSYNSVITDRWVARMESIGSLRWPKQSKGEFELAVVGESPRYKPRASRGDPPRD